jgi:hypothetical protein
MYRATDTLFMKSALGRKHEFFEYPLARFVVHHNIEY